MTTTIDLDLQEKAREAIQKILTDPSGPAAALVAIDPRTGAVKAMFGGTNFRRSQFNLATQAERQPGSSFKPIVLASALHKGIAPETRITSKPIEIDAGDRIWPVKNYEGSYLGSVDLTTAMIHSDNSVYAQLTNIVGPKAIVETAHRLGIRSELPAYFSIGLGFVAVNPLDMTRAYATIANDGKRVDGSVMGNRPRVVRSVRFRKTGKVSENDPVDKAVLSPAEAETMTAILEQVVQQGTGKRAQLAGHVAAGKTGTNDDYADAWFVGYTPELAVAVWVGYPNELKPMETEFHGEPVAGGTLPALIWKAFMTQALAGKPASSFTSPPYLPTYQARVVYRGGKWRLDNGYCPATRDDHVLRGPPAGLDGDVLRERGLGARRRRALRGVGARRAPIGAADGRRRLRAREAANAAGRGREADAARRVPLRERVGAPVGVGGAERPRAEPRRLEPSRSARAQPEAQAPAQDPVRRRARGHRPQAEPRGRHRRAAGAAAHAARRPRLDQLARPRR